MKKSYILLAAALILAAACTKESSETVLRFRVDVSEPAETKATIARDGEGLKFAWEADDVLCLNFEQGGMWYSADAAISSFSGPSAEFTVTLPSGIDGSNPFNVYAMYQKIQKWSLAQNRKWDSDGVFQFVKTESSGVTLDKGSDAEDVRNLDFMRPALFGKQETVTSSTLTSFTLEHLGWVMCVHLRNKSGAVMNVPYGLIVKGSSDIFMASANPFYYIATGPYINTWSCSFDLNRSNHYWEGKTIDNGSEEMFYRWIVSVGDLPALTVQMDPTSADGDNIDATTQLPAKTVFPGKMYHVYLNWDGTNLTLGK